MVKEMAFVAYSVRDVPRAVELYRDVMGFKPAERFGDHWVEFDVGGTTFGIGNGEPLGIPPGSSFAATFEVDDLAAERSRLKGLGIDVTEVMSRRFAGARSSPTLKAIASAFTSASRANANRGRSIRKRPAVMRGVVVVGASWKAEALRRFGRIVVRGEEK